MVNDNNTTNTIIELDINDSQQQSNHAEMNDINNNNSNIIQGNNQYIYTDFSQIHQMPLSSQTKDGNNSLLDSTIHNPILHPRSVSFNTNKYISSTNTLFNSHSAGP